MGRCRPLVCDSVLLGLKTVAQRRLREREVRNQGLFGNTSYDPGFQ